MKGWINFIQRQLRSSSIHVANTVPEFFKLRISTAKISYVSSVCRYFTAKSSLIPCVEIATETWFQQPGMLW